MHPARLALMLIFVKAVTLISVQALMRAPPPDHA
jgi:hypothetical protein